jgi:hypothetical protein
LVIVAISVVEYIPLSSDEGYTFIIAVMNKDIVDYIVIAIGDINSSSGI